MVTQFFVLYWISTHVAQMSKHCTENVPLMPDNVNKADPNLNFYLETSEPNR